MQAVVILMFQLQYHFENIRPTFSTKIWQVPNTLWKLYYRFWISNKFKQLR